MSSQQQQGGHHYRHATLRRVLPKGVVVTENAAEQHRRDHPGLFSSSTSAHSMGPNSAASSLADSCYSSCSEGEHSALSRETSDSSSASSAGPTMGLAEEFCQKMEIGRWDGPVEGALLEFATRLGFTQAQLRTVLAQLDGDTQQDRVLSALIKLGGSGQGDGFGVVENPRRKTTTGMMAGREPPKLRPIVLDGSNIAMTHGNKAVFSCRGIRDCVNFFAARGHTDILVFVPQFRREQPRPEAPIVDQHILMELEAERRLVWTPSRRVGGRRIVCHDDRYILKTAAEKQAIVVSNDEYRDLVRENPKWRAVVENLLLMYSFVDGKFMPPDDPLGRRGPGLDQFLTFAPASSSPLNAQPCPYAKKCTYGNKCKYFHPERPAGIWMGAADRLIAGIDAEEGTATAKSRHSLAPRPSLIAEGCHPGGHANVGRTRSLNLPAGQNMPFSLAVENNGAKEARRGGNHQLLPSFPPPSLNHHAPVLRIESSPAPSPTIGTGDSDAHFPLGRILSAPPPLAHFGHMFAPCPSIWGDCEFSLRPPPSSALHPPSIPPPPSAAVDHCPLPPASGAANRRQRLQYHLSQLFPEPTVLAVMAAHPNETDAQRLCQRIIAFQRGFQQQEGEGGESAK